jgi:hypothetical protein
MKNQWAASVVVSCALAAVQAVAAPVGTAFTYQGQLRADEVPYDGLADLQFSLWTDPGAGSQVGSTLTRNNVDVVNGLFAVDLDFAAGSFAGDARYVQVAVKAPAGLGSFVPVSPRQPITPAPYAIHALNAPTGHSLDAVDGTPVDAVFVDDVADVGIGTTNPSGRLHVVGAAAPPPGPIPDNGLLLGSNGTASYKWIQSYNGPLSLNSQGNNVGIGTASPDNTLHVHKGSAGAITANSSAPLVVESNGNAYVNLLAPDANESAVLFGRPGSIVPTAAGGIIFNNAANADGLLFRTGGNQTRMTIDSVGDVGIGTASPSGRLHIVGAAAPPGSLVGADNGLLLGSSGTASYKWIQSYGAALALNPAGNNVGIGTTTPGFPLTFANVLGDKISLWGQSGSHYGFGIQNSLLQVHTDASVSDIAFGFGSSAAFTERMRIKGTGNVGIGTTSPVNNLHLIEDSGTARIRVESADGQAGISFLSDSTVETVIYSPDGSDDLRFFVNNADRVAINSSGNVGIGTNSPSQKLVVNGNVHVTGEVQRPTTGAANMVPICYGHVDADGTIASGSGNFSASWRASADDYLISVTGEDFGVGTNYTVLVTVWGATGFTTGTGTVGGDLVVNIGNAFGSVQKAFSFLVFKP